GGGRGSHATTLQAPRKLRARALQPIGTRPRHGTARHGTSSALTRNNQPPDDPRCMNSNSETNCAAPPGNNEPVTSEAVRPPAPGDLADARTALDTLIGGTPGGAALAWVDSDDVTFLTAGVFDSDEPRPVTPDTQFHISSITKVFTALLLAKSER